MTTSSPAQETAEVFAALAKLVYQGASFSDIYEAVCATAVAVVPGCDHACVTTIRAGGRTVSEAATSEVARRFDELEWDIGEGPCVDAIREERFEFDPDITSHASWPRLARRVLEELPIRGMAGYRIVAAERKVGALNLLSETPGALTEEAGTLGAIVAAFASVALAAANERETTSSLRSALDSSREIGRAVGILMATRRIGEEAAFEMLRGASNQLNVRVAELARRIAEDPDGFGTSRS